MQELLFRAAHITDRTAWLAHHVLFSCCLMPCRDQCRGRPGLQTAGCSTAHWSACKAVCAHRTQHDSQKVGTCWGTCPAGAQ